MPGISPAAMKSWMVFPRELGSDRFETRILYFGISFDLARRIRDHGSNNNGWLQSLELQTADYNVLGFFQTGFIVDLNHGAPSFWDRHLQPVALIWLEFGFPNFRCRCRRDHIET
jgi:hypothetical protein